MKSFLFLSLSLMSAVSFSGNVEQSSDSLRKIFKQSVTPSIEALHLSQKWVCDKEGIHYVFKLDKTNRLIESRHPGKPLRQINGEIAVGDLDSKNGVLEFIRVIKHGSGAGNFIVEQATYSEYLSANAWYQERPNAIGHDKFKVMQYFICPRQTASHREVDAQSIAALTYQDLDVSEQKSELSIQVDIYQYDVEFNQQFNNNVKFDDALRAAIGNIYSSDVVSSELYENIQIYYARLFKAAESEANIGFNDYVKMRMGQFINLSSAQLTLYSQPDYELPTGDSYRYQDYWIFLLTFTGEKDQPTYGIFVDRKGEAETFNLYF